MQARILPAALTILSTSMLLGACSTSALRPDAQPAALASADEGYVRGRNLHLARRYDEAIAVYQDVVAVRPDHVNARNGLAIAYAEQREFDKAIPIWRALTVGATMASGPGMGFLFANLGYAYFLQGHYDEAQVALEKACLLDPLNARGWQYLGETLQKLGQGERAAQMLRQAGLLRDHDVRVDYAAAEGGAHVPAIERAVRAGARPDQDWAFVEVGGKPGGLLELRRSVPLAVRAEPAAVPAAPIAATPGVTRPALVALEISNGNGRAGLARQVARDLREPGMKVVRLTNAKGYGVRQTRIEYQTAFRELAERLASRFGVGTPVQTSLAAHVDVRIVIGHDMPAGRSAQRPLHRGAALAVVSASQQ